MVYTIRVKIIVLLSLFFCTFSANAFVYLAGSVSSVKQIDTSDDGDVNDGLLVQGLGQTAYIGFRFPLLSFEVFSKAFKADGKDGNLKFKLEDEMQGFGIRLYVFSWLNIKYGAMKHDASGDVVNTSTDAVLLEYESTSNGTYGGVGLNFPMGRWSIFLDFTQYASEHDTIDDSGILMHDYEVGMRYLF